MLRKIKTQLWPSREWGTGVLDWLKNLLVKIQNKNTGVLIQKRCLIKRSRRQSSRNWVPPLLKLVLHVSGPGITQQLDSSSFLEGRNSTAIQNYSVKCLWGPPIPSPSEKLWASWVFPGVVLILIVNLTHLEEGPLVEMLPPSDWSVDMSVGHSLDF